MLVSPAERLRSTMPATVFLLGSLTTDQSILTVARLAARAVAMRIATRFCARQLWQAPPFGLGSDAAPVSVPLFGASAGGYAAAFAPGQVAAPSAIGARL